MIAVNNALATKSQQLRYWLVCSGNPIGRDMQGFENTIGNPFFDFVKYRPKRSNSFFFFKNSSFIVLYEKKASDLILDFGKCPNRKTCTFTFMRFSVGARSKIKSGSVFLIKYYIITILFFLTTVFAYI